MSNATGADAGAKWPGMKSARVRPDELRGQKWPGESRRSYEKDAGRACGEDVICPLCHVALVLIHANAEAHEISFVRLERDAVASSFSLCFPPFFYGCA